MSNIIQSSHARKLFRIAQDLNIGEDEPVDLTSVENSIDAVEEDVSDVETTVANIKKVTNGSMPLFRTQPQNDPVSGDITTLEIWPAEQNITPSAIMYFEHRAAGQTISNDSYIGVLLGANRTESMNNLVSAIRGTVSGATGILKSDSSPALTNNTVHKLWSYYDEQYLFLAPSDVVGGDPNYVDFNYTRASIRFADWGAGIDTVFPKSELIHYSRPISFKGEILMVVSSQGLSNGVQQGCVWVPSENRISSGFITPKFSVNVFDGTTGKPKTAYTDIVAISDQSSASGFIYSYVEFAETPGADDMAINDTIVFTIYW